MSTVRLLPARLIWPLLLKQQHFPIVGDMLLRHVIVSAHFGGSEVVHLRHANPVHLQMDVPHPALQLLLEGQRPLLHTLLTTLQLLQAGLHLPPPQLGLAAATLSRRPQGVASHIRRGRFGGVVAAVPMAALHKALEFLWAQVERRRIQLLDEGHRARLKQRRGQELKQALEWVATGLYLNASYYTTQ